MKQSVPRHLCLLPLQGVIAAAEEEEVLPGELREAWFTILHAAHKGAPRPGPFYSRCGLGTKRSTMSAAVSLHPAARVQSF